MVFVRVCLLMKSIDVCLKWRTMYVKYRKILIWIYFVCLGVCVRECVLVCVCPHASGYRRTGSVSPLGQAVLPVELWGFLRLAGWVSLWNTSS